MGLGCDIGPKGLQKHQMKKQKKSSEENFEHEQNHSPPFGRCGRNRGSVNWGIRARSDIGTAPVFACINQSAQAGP
jgi:hypothetical protein